MPDETFHPYIYFWIAFYKDGTCLTQFDLQTGIFHEFKEIEQDRLDRFGLVPLNPALAIKACMAAGYKIAEARDGLSYLILRLQKDQRLIYYRRNKIHNFEYDYCEVCGYKWVWMPTHKAGEITETDLPIHPDFIVQTFQGKEFPCCKCPKCGAINAIVCPDCKDVLINELKRPDSEKHYFQCPKCKKEFPRHIKLLGDAMRKAIYMLGHQTTVGGKNSKQIMFINEDGTIELSEDFNYK
jgi:hypothetical protein